MDVLMRYLPLTNKDRKEMLQSIGAISIDDFYNDIPDKAKSNDGFNIENHKSELEIEREFSKLANKNRAASKGNFFLGAGCYYHHIPASADHIIQRSEFLTAYTPYQPEIAQGTLQTIFEYQTMICRLTGQDVSNASLYDGATAMAEAALMAMRVKRKSNIIIGNDIHPDYINVLNTYIKDKGEITNDESNDVAAVIIQSPDFNGTPHSLDEYRKKCDELGCLLIVVINEIVSLGMLPAPTEADIVCGEGQSIGLPMSFGGPHLGFFACKQKYLRQLPGRVCGETVDKDGKRGFVLTLSTREQHIRREKATSNICTNQGLCALAFTVHMSLLGETGLKKLAKINHYNACKLADAITQIDGCEIINKYFFNEFVVKFNKDADIILSELLEKDIIGGYKVSHNEILVTATEMTTEVDIENLCNEIKSIIAK